MSTCISAKTSLIVPFEGPAESPDGDLEAVLRRRAVGTRDGRDGETFWRERKVEVRAPQIDELAPATRLLLGRTTGGEDSPWAVRRLELAAVVRDRLFGHRVQLVGPGVEWDVCVEAVELITYPLGGGAVVLDLDWGVTPLALPELADRISMAHRLGDEREDRAACWRLGRPDARPLAAPLAVWMGPTLAAALGPDRAPVRLREIVVWLLGEHGPAIPPTRFALHQTAARLDGPPDGGALRADLWRLRRAYDGAHVAPLDDDDPQLCPRGNRWIGVAREGATSVSWTVAGAAEDFEALEWPLRFTGIYLALHVHALAERAALQHLAREAVRRLDDADVDALSLEELRERRGGLRRLAARMVQYTVAISFDDCGGSTDYVRFFAACRRVHGIQAQRAELRKEIEELLGLVDQQTREIEERVDREERSATERHRVEAQRNRDSVLHAQNEARILAEQRWRDDQARLARVEADQRAIDARRDEAERAFHRLVAGATAFAVPVTVLSGLFGMNIFSEGLPWGWWGFIGIVGVGLGIGFVVWRRAAQRLPRDG